MATLSAAASAPVSSRVSSANVAPPPKPEAEPAPKPANSNSSQVRYLSPVIEIDAEAGLALLQVRDVENGNVRFQLPPERVVREYKSTEAATNPPPAEPPRTESPRAESSVEAPPVATAAEAAATSSITPADPAAAKQA